MKKEKDLMNDESNLLKKEGYAGKKIAGLKQGYNNKKITKVRYYYWRVLF